MAKKEEIVNEEVENTTALNAEQENSVETEVEENEEFEGGGETQKFHEFRC